MELNRSSRRALLACLVWLCLGRALGAEPLEHHRNRLLDTLARQRGIPDRCAFWRTLDASQRGVFLTHTDLLGNRSCFGAARCAPGDEQALDHVVRLWALRGTDPTCAGCNGGIDWHRSFWEADAALLSRWRDRSRPLPAWRASHDLMGPHRPFDWTLETEAGPPRGQIQLFSSGAVAVPLRRAGVERLRDPDVFELDEDYNWRHDSNPEGSYRGIRGRALHERTWSPLGNGAAAAFAPEWAPRCGERRIERIVSNGSRTTLQGRFATQGNRVFWSSRDGVRTWEGSEVDGNAERLSIAFQPPRTPGFFYVEAQGVLSPLYANPTPP